jgi:hypothetical protein
MKIENLRTLIKESIQDYIKEIDQAANEAAMDARITKCEEAIQMRETKLNNLKNLEEAADMLDETKVKMMEKEINELKKAKAKFEKQKEKMANKGKKKEVTTDAKTDGEASVDEADVTAEMDMGEKPQEEALNESFLKMQKLAGVITEGQYRKKVQMLNEKMSYDDFESMVKPFLDLAKTKGWVWNGAGDSWFDIPSPAVALYHSTELPTTADGEFKGQKMIASKDPVISNQVQSYRGAIEQKQGDVIMQPDYDMDQAYFQSKDKSILDAIKSSMANSTDVIQDTKESSSQLTSSKDFEPVKYYYMILRKKAASAAAPQKESIEKAVNEALARFRRTGK